MARRDANGATAKAKRATQAPTDLASADAKINANAYAMQPMLPRHPRSTKPPVPHFMGQAASSV
jgi:hypothetical protein